MNIWQTSIRCIHLTWALPYTLVGIFFGLIALCLGARMRFINGAIEIAGGWLGKFLLHKFCPLKFSAVTFGHVILGASHARLADVRAHEHVHIRQYERWGILFIPLYLGSSVVQLIRGRDPYLDNYFEREARTAAA